MHQLHDELFVVHLNFKGGLEQLMGFSYVFLQILHHFLVLLLSLLDRLVLLNQVEYGVTVLLFFLLKLTELLSQLVVLSFELLDLRLCLA